MGFMSDKFGRKPAFFLSGFVSTVSMFVNRFSPVYAMAAVFVFMQGFGIGKKNVKTPPISSELYRYAIFFRHYLDKIHSIHCHSFNAFLL